MTVKYFTQFCKKWHRSLGHTSVLRKRSISYDCCCLVQEIDKILLKDFRLGILISYIYIYSYKRLIFLWQIVIEKYHLTSTSWVGPDSELIEVNSCTELKLRWCLKCMKFWMFQLYLYLLYFWDVGFALACKLIESLSSRSELL